MTSNAAASSVPLALRQGNQPSSPQTPNQFVSSNFSSPGSTFRTEEDVVIIELGSRFLRAGFAGEHSPQCIVGFGPRESRRLGDYSDWAPGRRKSSGDIDAWGHDHELWRLDIRDLDLGLVGDKIERAVRTVYNDYLLSDIGSARLVLVLPSTLPHPLLSTVISTLFDRWKYSKISLLPSPTMTAVGAGLRSALVVDIGWAETVVTAISEYREILIRRTTRAMRALIRHAGSRLKLYVDNESDRSRVDFDFAEDLMTRIAWCRQKDTDTGQKGSKEETEDDEHSPMAESHGSCSDDGKAINEEVEIDWPTATSSRPVKIPFSFFSDVVEDEFVAPGVVAQNLDDQEHSLPLLVYEALQSISIDARGVCMSRIIFMGGGSRILGLSHRVIDEVAALVEKHGWTRVRGAKADRPTATPSNHNPEQGKAIDARFRAPLPPGDDDVEAKLQKQRGKEESLTTVQGEFRQVDSLGPWTGASLLTSLKVQGLVEIEREKFQQHGLAGARDETAFSVVPPKTNYAGGLGKGGRDRNSWTLAGWA